jgi:hypothetical protein
MILWICTHLRISFFQPTKESFHERDARHIVRPPRMNRNSSAPRKLIRRIEGPSNPTPEFHLNFINSRQSQVHSRV